ncbi:hypothetical protein T265_07537 [Opisthorchis viverrini]|uniref:mRNA-decapping enzyme C-terminal domain-containing protein n=1 Tax=Opisthorchis viverrini TaxID=6198 RepID=A0A074ZNK1_OPIVI|nr:hypothetical protein T265_07537 [Opisthorchis viverrini]KER24915.1 hypothetical protein T265_07537 [Opisthorchis viverrini]
MNYHSDLHSGGMIDGVRNKMAGGAALNVSVIQTYDQFCTEILDKSSSAHVYFFQNESNSWVKSKIGGVFFLYKRSKVPFYSFMILNRKSPDMNQIEFVTSSLQIQLHAPFLLYKTAKGGIYSIWFFSRDDCVRIAERIGKLAFDLGGASLRAPPNTDKAHESNVSKTSPSDTYHGGALTTHGLTELLNMIRRSGDTAVDRDSQTPMTPSNRTSGQPNRRSYDDHSPGLGISHTSEHNQAPNLFDMLHKAEMDFNSESLQKTDNKTENDINKELQRLRTACNIISPHSKSTTVTQKTKTPVPVLPKLVPSEDSFFQSGDHISVAELEQQLLREHSCIPGYFARDDATDGSSNDDQCAQAKPDVFQTSKTSLTGVPIRSSVGNTSNPSRLLSDLDAGYADDIDETCEDDSRRGRVGIHRKQRRHIRQRETVRTSGDRISSEEWGQNADQSCTLNVYSREEAKDGVVQEETLVTPAMLCSPPSAFVTYQKTQTTPTFASTGLSQTTVLLESKNSRTTGNEGLTKEQLREALIYMLQNDDSFLHQLHSAYMMSLQRRLSNS